jgi:hypothetical protein
VRFDPRRRLVICATEGLAELISEALIGRARTAAAARAA